MFVEIYQRLLSEYGPQGWWPVTPPGERTPRYTGGPRDSAQRFEVAVGALLTQNTSWRNASRAIENLNDARLLSPAGIGGAGKNALARLIRPAGYFNQKAARLETLARFFEDGSAVTRDNLLALAGVGPETADSILLYGFGKPFFVVDAYTRRIFDRLGLLDGRAPYERIRRIFEGEIPRNARLYNEYHALIVEHAKRFCRKRPLCGDCPLRDRCRAAGAGA
ncbi:MAG TPA: endonuclease III domain-containing protein [Candidatus Eisenbacteria bacterium]|uniref:Endonuclease III domain-containing protein n=1 Tax=Eiseniibacteriota bacterium TaxID=2212470 RepID=A0A7V2ATX7_UNCEI|nr:endonuclease III domain-containing protein [Candidatus Eisenbacteria bacterium]